MATPDDSNHAAIPLRSAATDSKTPYNYAHTHTQAHPKQLEATVTMGPKKRQTDSSPTRLSSLAAATSHRKTQGFVLRLPPQHKTHATLMQPLQCVLQHHVANLHVYTHMATPDDSNHAAIPLRSATTDSKTPYNYALTHKHTQSSLKPPLQWGQKKRQTDRSRTRRTDEVPVIDSCSHFTRKNTRFRSPASSPKQSPHNTHAAITMHFAAFPSSPVPFLTTSHRHHLPSSPRPIVTTSHRHHIPSSPLPFVTTSCPLSPPCVIASYSFVMYC